MEKILEQKEQEKLRKEGKISMQEIAIQVGDILLAHDAYTGARRPIYLQESMVEPRRLLRD